MTVLKAVISFVKDTQRLQPKVLDRTRVIRGGIRRRRRYGHEGINWDVSLDGRSNLVREYASSSKNL
jgi:hypothetical protein